MHMWCGSSTGRLVPLINMASHCRLCNAAQEVCDHIVQSVPLVVLLVGLSCRVWHAYLRLHVSWLGQKLQHV